MENWQQIATLLIVAAAGLYLLRRMVGIWRGKSAGCGTGSSACGHCPSAPPQDQKELVSLEVTMSGPGVRNGTFTAETAEAAETSTATLRSPRPLR